MEIPKIRVLLVEDNPADATLLEEYLDYAEHYRFQISHAMSLNESRNYLEDIDVVIVDLGLPDSQGLETVLNMVEYFPSIPIIVLTGNEDTKLGIDAVKSGAQDFLAKNHLNTSILIKAILHAIERKHLLVELDQLKEQEHKMATHDALTGLPNRFALMNKMDDIIDHAKRSNEQIAVLFLDLDHFKIINDTQGHNIGDEVLKIVSSRLNEKLRKSDVVARIGGDEFICVLRDVRNILNISGLSSTLINLLREPILIKEKEFNIGCSIGIATYPKDGDNSTDLLKSADTAMYVAKEKGRNKYIFSDPSFNQKVKQQYELEQELKQAIVNKELVIYYQPIIETSNHQLISCEALIRWDHPTRGILSPGIFLPLAKKSELIIQIGEYVLREVASDLRTWRKKSLQPIRISVNISPTHFKQKNFIENYISIFDKAGMSCENIDIEITEDALLADTESIQNHFQRLIALGTGISIDDFGTGYSSLKYLSDYPLTTLKIDRSFILNAINSENDRTIIKTIMALAKQLNLKVIAEGIETAEHANILSKMECTTMQGFYYSRPINKEDFEQYMIEFHENSMAQIPKVSSY